MAEETYEIVMNNGRVGYKLPDPPAYGNTTVRDQYGYIIGYRPVTDKAPYVSGGIIGDPLDYGVSQNFINLQNEYNRQHGAIVGGIKTVYPNEYDPINPIKSGESAYTGVYIGEDNKPISPDKVRTGNQSASTLSAAGIASQVYKSGGTIDEYLGKKAEKEAGALPYGLVSGTGRSTLDDITNAIKGNRDGTSTLKPTDDITPKRPFVSANVPSGGPSTSFLEFFRKKPVDFGGKGSLNIPDKSTISDIFKQNITSQPKPDFQSIYNNPNNQASPPRNLTSYSDTIQNWGGLSTTIRPINSYLNKTQYNPYPVNTYNPYNSINLPNTTLRSGVPTIGHFGGKPKSKPKTHHKKHAYNPQPELDILRESGITQPFNQKKHRKKPLGGDISYPNEGDSFQTMRKGYTNRSKKQPPYIIYEESDILREIGLIPKKPTKKPSKNQKKGPDFKFRGI